MKKQPKKFDIKNNALLNLLLTGVLLFGHSAMAQNKVIVIPLGGADAISHPVAQTSTNSIGMQFNELPAGSFTMGSPVGEPGRINGEVQHVVTLSRAFRMQTTEVTIAQWNAVITGPQTNPSSNHTVTDILFKDYPVENVSWFDTVFFANQLSTLESLSLCYTLGSVTGTLGSISAISSVTMNANCTGYRLPTEAEWEYASRAGTTVAYANPLGFDSTDVETGSGFNGNIHAMGWYIYNNTGMGYLTSTKPVAKKQPNAWGLYDMHGNVWEWNWDWYAFFSSGAVTDPMGPATGATHMLRGGSWNNSARDTRSAFRSDTSPGNRVSSLGFRLVLPPS